MKKHIPNFITLLNLSSGVVGLIFIMRGELNMAVYLVFLSGILDFLDGFTARLLNAYSDLGESLDSLADVVSFGVLPSVIAFYALSTGSAGKYSLQEFTPYIALIIPAFSALRLAIFNLDDNQKLSFKGLPTPANAFLVSSAAFIYMNENEIIRIHHFVLLILIVAGCLLMVSGIRMFSLKSTKSGKYQKLLIILFLIVAILLIVFLGFTGIFFSLLLYVLISLVWQNKIPVG